MRLTDPDPETLTLEVSDRVLLVVAEVERVLVILRVCVSRALKLAVEEGDLLVVADAVSLVETVGDPVDDRVEDELRVPIRVIT